MLNPKQIGAWIQKRRTEKGLTQSELSERLMISPQAVSNWERGEAVPDTAVLLDLASVLETTVDNILDGGLRTIQYKRRISVKDLRAGVDSLVKLGDLIGKDNTVYEGLLHGVNERMNIDFQEMIDDPFLQECLVVELIIQHLQKNHYVDISEINAVLRIEKWRGMACDYAHRFGCI